MADYGSCQCGCGLPAPIAKRTTSSQGWFKGKPKRFIRGHARRILPIEATYIHRTVDGRIMTVHRRRAEQALGRPLPPGAEVHHADGSKRADGPLVICQDRAYHKLLHARMRIVRAGGHPDTERLCGRCRVVKPIAAFALAPKYALGTWHKCRQCQYDYYVRRRDARAA